MHAPPRGDHARIFWTHGGARSDPVVVWRYGRHRLSFRHSADVATGRSKLANPDATRVELRWQPSGQIWFQTFTDGGICDIFSCRPGSVGRPGRSLSLRREPATIARVLWSGQRQPERDRRVVQRRFILPVPESKPADPRRRDNKRDRPHDDGEPMTISGGGKPPSPRDHPGRRGTLCRGQRSRGQLRGEQRSAPSRAGHRGPGPRGDRRSRLPAERERPRV